MKIEFISVIISGLMATASAQAESALFDLFPSDSPAKPLAGGYELTLSGRPGIVGMSGAIGFKGKTALLDVGFSDIPKNLGPELGPARNSQSFGKKVDSSLSTP
jgi:hypothetical protein